MLVGGVVGHEVEQNLKPPPMGLHQQVVEVSQRAEAWIDVAIVGNVIAEINHRRRVNGRDPDRVDPKADKIIEPPLYPSEVADAVVVGVLKGPRVDLIDHTRLPPERGHANSTLGTYAGSKARTSDDIATSLHRFRTTITTLWTCR